MNLEKMKIDPTKEKNILSIIPDMDEEQKKIKGENSLLHLGMSSIIFATTAKVFLPNPLLSLIFYSLGIGATLFHVKGQRKGKYNALFHNCNLFKGEMYPELQEEKETSYGHCLRFSLPVGLSSDDFRNKKKAIEQFLDRKIEIKYSHKNILLEVYEQDLKQNYDFEIIETKGILELVIGHSFNKVITVNLTAGSPHILIAGETGSGKSTMLRVILTILMLTKDPEALRLHLIDLKRGAELGIFQKCEMVDSFSRTKEEAEKILHKISDEVDRRYDLFYKNDCVDIKEYNKKFKGKKLNYQLVIVDEFADLQNEKESISIVEELAAKARACGIHLIISTQRPDAKILNGRIKANVPIVVGLKTMNGVNSRIIIDQENKLENLRGKGHGILKYNGEEIEIQGINLKPNQARDILKNTYKKQTKNRNFMLKEETKTVSPGEVENFDFLQVLKGGK